MARSMIFYSTLLGLIFLAVSLQANPSFWSRTTDFLGEKYGNVTGIKKTLFGSSSWSSMLTVDPSNIVSRMIHHGGLLVTPAMDRDLKLMGEFCLAEKVQLNVVERRLLIHNFTIRLPDDDSSHDDALRIHRIALHWDSYFKPCVEIEVDDVFILVDFFNVFLTKNNWIAMSKKGFPPTFEDPDMIAPAKDYNAEDSMVRVGSIAFAGDVHLLLNSRPLQKPISNITFSFEKLKAFERIIKEESAKVDATGRRGCTTTAVYDLIEKQVKAVIQKVIQDIARDLALDNGQGTKDKLQLLKAGTKKTVKEYLLNAGEWSEQRLQKKLADELDKRDRDDEKPQGKRKQFLNKIRRFGLSQLNEIISMGEEKEEIKEEDEL
ncbi:unnamed protein product [Cylindrotheca closterium]|uniref:Uncharacterized protein n=1 Tax=Cylindrotheca closterium TaxID=2856 RepID=A0AAD2JJB1_9STRA|nr:unnamed protein product [Cylindrotheca closterium]